MARRPPRFRDPLAPLADQFLRRRARRDVRATIDPLIAEETRRVNASAAAGSRNIEDVTSRLAESLAGYGPKAGAIYDRSLSDLGALDTAVADRIGAAGNAGGEELRKRLELSGGDQGLAQALVGAGQGAGAAAFAHGGAERAALLQHRAAAEDYGAKLPGFARMQGAQDIGLLRAQKQRDLAEGLGQIRSQIPGLATGLLKDSDRLEFEKAALLRGLGLDYSKLAQEGREFSAEEARRRAEANERARHNRQTEKQAGATEAGRNRRAKATAARSGRTYNENLSRQRGYAVDGQGRPILDSATGQRIPYDPKKADKDSGSADRQWKQPKKQ